MKLEELTALYSPLDIEYSQAMSGEYEDLSFRNDEVTVIAGLKDGRISGFWRPVVAVGDERLQKLHIERLYDICRNIYYMDFLIDGKLSVISQFLLRYGHKARPYYTQIIDLTKSEEELHADLRKSYKSLVNWGQNEDNAHLTYLDYNGVKDAYRHWERFQRLHKEVSGKQTRSDKTWNIQCQQLEMNEAFSILMYIDKEIVAGGFFNCNQFSCYYGVGKTRRGIDSHALLYEAILFAKLLGCKTFEMGKQVFSSDEKLVNISKFKRGFGGTTKTRLIFEKEK